MCNKVELNGTVTVYGYLDNSDIGIFCKGSDWNFFSNNSSFQYDKAKIINIYTSLHEIGWVDSHNVILANEAARGALIGWPHESEFVYLQIKFHIRSFVVVTGLIRRLVKRQTRIKKIIFDKGSYAVFLECQRVQSKSERPDFYMSRSVGINGLLKYLNSEGVEYAVPRFFNNLPDLPSKKSDLDIIISDSDRDKVIEFILSNPGTQRIDLWPVKAPLYKGITYYPISLGNRILNDSACNKNFGGARVPSTSVAVYALLYHIVFHKGFASGVASTSCDVNISRKNKYLDELHRLDPSLNIKSLDDMYSYLKSSDFFPSLDTQRKIAQWNTWLRDKLEVEPPKDSDHTIYMLILKMHGSKLTNGDKLDMALTRLGARILKKATLNNEEVQIASEKWRGGVWAEHDFSADAAKFFPFSYYLIYFAHPTHPDISKFKRLLRHEYDADLPSYFHTTDDTIETKEYLEQIGHNMPPLPADIFSTPQQKSTAHFVKLILRLKAFSVATFRSKISRLLTEV